MAHRTLSYSRFLLVALLGVILLATGQRGFGQDTNASLSGTVTDPSNAAIPNAKLTLTNSATGFQSNFVSDETGAYTFRNLTPGTYKIEITAGGFQVNHANRHSVVAEPGIPSRHSPHDGSDE